MEGPVKGVRTSNGLAARQVGARPGNGCAGLEGEEETIIFEKKSEIRDVVIFCAGLTFGKTAKGIRVRNQAEAVRADLEGAIQRWVGGSARGLANKQRGMRACKGGTNRHSWRNEGINVVAKRGRKIGSELIFCARLAGETTREGKDERSSIGRVGRPEAGDPDSGVRSSKRACNPEWGVQWVCNPALGCEIQQGVCDPTRRLRASTA